VNRKQQRAQRLATWKQRVAHVFPATEKMLLDNRERLNAEGYISAFCNASYALVAGLVNKEVADRYIVGGGKNGALNLQLATFGETLFEMRNSPSLAEFCDRMASRTETRSAFYECFVARMFLDLSFVIMAIGETGVKGDDFDFTALGQGGCICAEVTCLQSAEFSEATIRNALRSKIEQVPKDQANAIFIVLPNGWFDVENAVERIVREVRRVFNVSRRANLVYFLGEKHDKVTTADGRQLDMLQYQVLPVFHPNPRNPNASVQFFHVFGHGGKDMSKDASVLEATEDELFSGKFTDRPFYQWVNRSVGRGA
jgi:hypothetical protein